MEKYNLSVQVWSNSTDCAMPFSRRSKSTECALPFSRLGLTRGIDGGSCTGSGCGDGSHSESQVSLVSSMKWLLLLRSAAIASPACESYKNRNASSRTASIGPFDAKTASLGTSTANARAFHCATPFNFASCSAYRERLTCGSFTKSLVTFPIFAFPSQRQNCANRRCTSMLKRQPVSDTIAFLMGTGMWP